MPHVTWGPNSSSLIFQCTSPVSGHPHSVFHRKLGIEVGYPQFLAILPTWSSMTSSTGQVGPPIEIPGISAELRSPTNPPGCSTHLLHQPDGWRMASPKGTKTRGRQPISVVSTWLCYVNLIAFILHIYIYKIHIYIIIYNIIYISIYDLLLPVRYLADIEESKRTITTSAGGWRQIKTAKAHLQTFALSERLCQHYPQRGVAVNERWPVKTQSKAIDIRTHQRLLNRNVDMSSADLSRWKKSEHGQPATKWQQQPHLILLRVPIG